MQLFKYSEKKRRLSKLSAPIEIKKGRICFKSPRGTLKIDIKMIEKIVIGINDETPYELEGENLYSLLAIYADNNRYYFVQDVEEENGMSIVEFMISLNAELKQMDDSVNRVLSIDPNKIFDEMQVDRFAEIQIISRRHSLSKESEVSTKSNIQTKSSSLVLSSSSSISKSNSRQRSMSGVTEMSDISASSLRNSGDVLVNVIRRMTKQMQKMDQENKMLRKTQSIAKKSKRTSTKTGFKISNIIVEKDEELKQKASTIGSTRRSQKESSCTNANTFSLKSSRSKSSTATSSSTNAGSRRKESDSSSTATSSSNSSIKRSNSKMNPWMMDKEDERSSTSSSAENNGDVLHNVIRRMTKQMTKMHQENEMLRKTQSEMEKSSKTSTKAESKISSITIEEEQESRQKSSIITSPQSSEDDDNETETSTESQKESNSTNGATSSLESSDKSQRNESESSSTATSSSHISKRDNSTMNPWMMEKEEKRSSTSSSNSNEGTSKSKSGSKPQRTRSPESTSRKSVALNNTKIGETEKELQEISQRYTQMMQSYNGAATALTNDEIQTKESESSSTTTTPWVIVSKKGNSAMNFLMIAKDDKKNHESMRRSSESSGETLIRISRENQSSIQKLHLTKKSNGSMSINYHKLQRKYKDLKKRYEDLQKECANGQAKIDKLEKELESVQKEYWNLDERRTTNINSLQAKHDALEVSLREKNEIIKAAMKETLSLREEHKKAMDKMEIDSSLLLKLNRMTAGDKVEIKAQRNSINELQSKCDRLKAAMVQKNEIMKGAARQTIELKEAHERAMEEIRLRQRNDDNYQELVKKYNELKEDFQTSVIDGENERNALRARNEHLENENMKLQQQKVTGQREKEDDNYRELVEKYNELNEDLKNSVVDGKNERNALRTRNEELENENVKLQQRLDEMLNNQQQKSTNGMNGYEKRIQELRNEELENENENKKLQQKVDNRMNCQQNKATNEKGGHDEYEKHIIESRNEELENENKKLQQKLDKMMDSQQRKEKNGMNEYDKYEKYIIEPRNERTFDFEMKNYLVFEPSLSDISSVNDDAKRTITKGNKQKQHCAYMNCSNIYSPQSGSMQIMSPKLQRFGDDVGEVKEEVSDSVRIIGKNRQYPKRICVTSEYVAIGSARFYYKDINKLSCCCNSVTKWMMLTNDGTIRIKSRSAKDRHKLMTFIQSQMWFTLCGCCN